MKTLLMALISMSTISTAYAGETKVKWEEGRDVAEVESEKSHIQEVERPESLKGSEDSPAYKRHKEYLKQIDRHDKMR